jgi:hypothetical protein
VAAGVTLAAIAAEVRLRPQRRPAGSALDACGGPARQANYPELDDECWMMWPAT